MFNCAPPKLLFTNNGNRSPQDFPHDAYGLPVWGDGSFPDLTTDLQEDCNSSYWAFYGQRTIPENFHLLKEKHYFYGTIFEEIMAWMNTVADRHGFSASTTGELLPWRLPNMELMNDPQEDGEQLDGYSLHNPEWWHLWFYNFYTLQKRGPFTAQEKELLVDYLVAKEFPVHRDSDENRYFDAGYFNNQNFADFTYGKINEQSIETYIFPFRLTKRIRISYRAYKVESSAEVGGGGGGTFDNLSDLTFRYATGSQSSIHARHTWNRTTDNPFYDYYQYFITLIRFPYPNDVSLINNTDIYIDDYTETPRKLTLRNALGFYGDGRNGALAFDCTTKNNSVYGDNNIIDGDLTGFKLGVIWCDCNEDWNGFPELQNNETFTYSEFHQRVLFFHDLSVGQNIAEIPDSILDEEQEVGFVPFFVFSPPDEEVPASNRIYEISIRWESIDAFDVSTTGYAHNYPVTGIRAVDFFNNEEQDLMRFCTDDYLMSLSEVIR